MNPKSYMNRCLELAIKGAGYVAPNPMVGAVLVHDDRIIGEGWHREYGKAHAEVNAVANAIEQGHDHLLPLSSLYVSLEPCSHYGKTPPCTNLIIEKKIPRVIIACRDPFPEVNGKGIEILRAASVEVEQGLLEKEAQELNKRFFTYHSLRRPYVILKWAQTADGLIASGNENRLLISNEYSARRVHQWRSEEAAILVGTHTAILDDPSLTTRLWPGPSPLRVVIDLDLRLPSSLKIFDKEARTLLINFHRQEVNGHLEYCQVKENEPLIPQLMNILYAHRILSLLVEGGARLLNSFIESRTWDEARVIKSSMRAGQGLKAPLLNYGSLTMENEIVGDLHLSYHQQ